MKAECIEWRYTSSISYHILFIHIYQSLITLKLNNIVALYFDTREKTQSFTTKRMFYLTKEVYFHLDFPCNSNSCFIANYSALLYSALLCSALLYSALRFLSIDLSIHPL